MKNIPKLLTFMVLVLLIGCKSTYDSKAFLEKNIPKIPDYDQAYAWVALPNAYPESLEKFIPKNYLSLKADVFYIYPTLNTDYDDDRWNISVFDIVQNDKVKNIAVYFQASAFLEAGKLYAPFYRQAHIRSFKRDFKPEGNTALKLAYTDVKNAFKTYLKNYNNNRPIIIAAHSQGSFHAIQLLKDFFDEKPLQKRLIAAYIPGMRVKPDEFKSIKPMTKPTETGGFVSWNTFKQNNYPKNKGWYTGSVTTNPITWNSQITTKLDDHKGFLYTNNKLYINSLKIEIIDGLVWSTVPKFPLRIFMSFMKNYHAGDINLFWQDIKENSVLRKNTWLEKNTN